MGRPKIKTSPEPMKARVTDENGNITEVDEVGVPGMFLPTDFDVDEEFENNEAFLLYRKEKDQDEDDLTRLR